MTHPIKCAIQTTQDELDAHNADSKDIVIESINPLERSAQTVLGEARFIEPVTAIIAAVSVASLGKYVITHFLKGTEQGMQIDLRTVPPTLTSVPHVPTGTFIIIDKQGKAAIHKGAYDEPDKLVPLLSPLFKHS